MGPTNSPPKGELAGIPTMIHTYTGPSGRRLLACHVARPVCADLADISWLAVAGTCGDALTPGCVLGLTIA